MTARTYRGMLINDQFCGFTLIGPVLSDRREPININRARKPCAARKRIPRTGYGYRSAFSGEILKTEIKIYDVWAASSTAVAARWRRVDRIWLNWVPFEIDFFFFFNTMIYWQQSALLTQRWPTRIHCHSIIIFVRINIILVLIDPSRQT